jgi:uroporphyrinogen-III synthase
MAAPERPLAGRSLLVTRPADRAGRLAARLRTLGARVELRPTIALGPPTEPARAREAVRSVRSFDWVVFTSTNGVAFFEALFREVHGVAGAPLERVAAIGPATARAAAEAGHVPRVVATDSTAEGLALALGGSIERGARVLIVRPEVARPVLERALEARGARVEAVAFYRNVAAPDAAAVAGAIQAGSFDAVLLSSPSSLERLLESGPEGTAPLVAALGRTRIVAIGPVTARAVERYGLSVAAVAARPTDDAVVDCLRRLFT